MMTGFPSSTKCVAKACCSSIRTSLRAFGHRSNPMADVYLSTTMRGLVAEYGNQLEGRQGIDPAIIAYDLVLNP
jgi:hypothetical protein